MPLRALPYLLGAFVLLPFAIWLGLWGTSLGGPKQGFDDPLANALLAVSVPLVFWFLIASLGSIANSMGGASEFEAPRFGLARWTLRLLPALTLALGVGAGVYLMIVDGPSLTIGLPLAVALLFAFAIRKGENRRANDAGASLTEPRLRDRARPATSLVKNGVIGFVLALPVLGAIIGDVAGGRARARLYFALNVGAAWLAALWFFGPVLIIWTALAATAAMFVALIYVTSMR